MNELIPFVGSYGILICRTAHEEEGWKCRRLGIDDWMTKTEIKYSLESPASGHGRVQSLACSFPFTGCI